jgi:hypothetical protein
MKQLEDRDLYQELQEMTSEDKNAVLAFLCGYCGREAFFKAVDEMKRETR